MRRQVVCPPAVQSVVGERHALVDPKLSNAPRDRFADPKVGFETLPHSLKGKGAAVGPFRERGDDAVLAQLGAAVGAEHFPRGPHFLDVRRHRGEDVGDRAVGRRGVQVLVHVADEHPAFAAAHFGKDVFVQKRRLHPWEERAVVPEPRDVGGVARHFFVRLVGGTVVDHEEMRRALVEVVLDPFGEQGSLVFEDGGDDEHKTERVFLFLSFEQLRLIVVENKKKKFIENQKREK